FIPGSMFSGKNVAAILSRELLALVESHLQRRDVRLDQHVGNNDFIFQFGMLAFVTRILMSANVIPGPAIEASVLDVSDVIRRQIVADLIPLVYRAPELSRFRIDRLPHAVANS